MTTPMKTHSLIAVILAAVTLMGCGSDERDAALAGTWIRMRDANEVRDKYMFGADGSFAFDENKPTDPENEDHLMGTYTVANGIVTATVTGSSAPPAAQGRLIFSYYASATQFSAGILRPRAGHMGLVGMWTGVKKVEGVDGSGPTASGVELAWEVRVDGSFRETRTPVGGPVVMTSGTWLADTDGTFRLTTDQPDTLVTFYKTVTLVDDKVLVDSSSIWTKQ